MFSYSPVTDSRSPGAVKKFVHKPKERAMTDWPESRQYYEKMKERQCLIKWQKP